MTEEKKFKQRVRDRMAQTGESYTNARRVLHQETAPLSSALPVSEGPERRYAESRRKFRETSLAAWRELATELVGSRDTFTWTNSHDIVQVLKYIAERAPLNHTYFPNGGGLDLTGAYESHEPGCITLDMQGPAIVVRPQELVLTRPEQDPLGEWAYYRLETGNLDPSGVYEKVLHNREKLVELAPGHYIDSSHWDSGCFGADEHGNDLTLPEAARLITRYLRGPFLIVASGSFYNTAPEFYDGVHARTSAEEFRNEFRLTVQELHRRGLYGLDLGG